MTATLPAQPADLPTAGPGTGWRDDLARLLHPTVFPARQDELLAALIRHRAPSHLLWRLTCLPRTRRYATLDELSDYVAGHTPEHTVQVPF
jgi:Protein of unknown function (DUF2795)